MICVCLSETDFHKCYELTKKFDLSEIRLDLQDSKNRKLKKYFLQVQN